MRDFNPLLLGTEFADPSGIGLRGEASLDFSIEEDGSEVVGEGPGYWGVDDMRTLREFDPPLDMEGWDGLAIHLDHSPTPFAVRFRLVLADEVEGSKERIYDARNLRNRPSIAILDAAGSSGIRLVEVLANGAVEILRYQRAEFLEPAIDPLEPAATFEVDPLDDPYPWSITSRLGAPPGDAGFDPSWDVPGEVVASGTFASGEVLSIERDYGSEPLGLSGSKILAVDAFGPRGGSGTLHVRIEAPDGRARTYVSDDCGQGFRTLLLPVIDLWDEETLDEVKIVTVGVSGVLGGPHRLGVRSIRRADFRDLSAAARGLLGLPSGTAFDEEFDAMLPGEWLEVERLGPGDSGDTEVVSGGSILSDTTFVGVRSGIEEGEYGMEKTYSPPLDLRQWNTLTASAASSVSGTAARMRLELVDPSGVEIRTAWRDVPESYADVDFDVELAPGMADLSAVERVRVIVDPVAPLAGEDSVMVLDRLFPGIPIVTDEATTGVDVRSLRRSTTRTYRGGWFRTGT